MYRPVDTDGSSEDVSEAEDVELLRTWLLLSEQLQWPFSCASESKFQALSHGNIHEA